MVAKPGLALVTLRTIQRHSFIITGNPPPGIPINPVHDIIGTLESTVIFQVIIYYFIITNEDGMLKRGLSTDYGYCKFAIMNPELTFSSPSIPSTVVPVSDAM